MNKLLRKCRVVAATFLILSATSSVLAQSMPPILEDGFGGPSGNVLWDSATDGFPSDSLRNDGVASTSVEFNSTIGSNIYRMEYTGGGDSRFGAALLGSSYSDVLNAMADTGQINIRYLIRFGTEDNSPEWATGGGAQSYELKFPDFFDGASTQRILFMQRPVLDNDVGVDRYSGSIVMVIDGTGGEVQVNIPDGRRSDNWGQCITGSNIWTYVEIQVRNDGSVTHWYSPYDGSGTEYSQGSPNAHQAAIHTYNFEWLRSLFWIDFGYRNHNSAGNPNRIDARLTISNSFIGPD